MNNKKKKRRKNKLWLKTLSMMSIALFMTTTLPIIENSIQNVEAAGELIRTFNNTSTGQNGANVNNSSGTLGGNITMSGGKYLWVVPYSGAYQVTTKGARGGSTLVYGGGSGAIVTCFLKNLP